MMPFCLMLVASLCQQRTVYYAAGFANHATMKGRFELAEATFELPSGSLLFARNITAMDAFMMGYVRINPCQKQAIFLPKPRIRPQDLYHPMCCFMSYPCCHQNQCWPLLDQVLSSQTLVIWLQAVNRPSLPAHRQTNSIQPLIMMLLVMLFKKK